MATKLPLGIHFGLDEIEHHLDPGLGSSDMKRLERSLSAYWWYSGMNPSRPPVDKTTEDREEGKAIHKVVLEGPAAFERSYVRRPDDPEGTSSSDKGAVTKEWNKKAAAAGKKLLKAEKFDRCAFVGASIAANPGLIGAFQGGMPEVTIIVQREGVRLKARIDYLKYGIARVAGRDEPAVGLGDLKTIINEREREFSTACRLQMKDLRMTLQAVHYMDIWAMAPKLIADGLVHGDHDPEWLKKIAGIRKFAWQWVFYQKAHAPLVWSRTLSPANPIVRSERDVVRAAVARYKDGMERFGPEQMWIDHEEPVELDESDLSYPFG